MFAFKALFVDKLQKWLPLGFLLFTSPYQEMEGSLGGVIFEARPDIILAGLALKGYSSQDVLHLLTGRRKQNQDGGIYVAGLQMKYCKAFSQSVIHSRGKESPGKLFPFRFSCSFSSLPFPFSSLILSAGFWIEILQLSLKVRRIGNT